VIVDELSAPGGFAFDADSRRLAIGHANGSIHIYALPSNRQLKQLECVSSHGRLAFHPEGRQLAVSCATGIKVYDLETRRVLAHLRQPAETNSLAWHPDGKTLAAACDDSRIYLWDVAAQKRTHVLEGSRSVGIAIAFNRSGDLLVSSGWEGVLRLWHSRTGTQLFTMPSGGYGFFDSYDRLLAYDLRDGKLVSWEVAARGEYRTLARGAAAGQRYYDNPAVRSDGRVLAVATHDGVGLWDLPSGKELAFLDSPGTNFALFEPSGSLLTNGSVGLLRWPVETDHASPGLLRIGLPRKLPVPGPVCHIASSADGRVIAVSQFQGGRVLHSDRPDQPVSLGPHEDARYVAVSPDGRWVGTGSHIGTAVKIWVAQTGKLEKELLVDGGSRVGFSPDGKWLATTGGELRLWAVGSWREGPKTGVGGAFAFSPDGKLLAADTAHGAVRLIDPETGREHARLEDPNQDRALFLSFSPDGTQLVTTKGNTQPIHVWDLRAIREQLVNMGLDWALPPYPPALNVNESQPLRVEVELGDPVQVQRDREEAARQLIEQKRLALEANPNDAKASNDLAWTYLIAPAALRDWKAALPVAQKAVQLAPDPMNRNTLGLAYYRAGRYPEAVQTLERNLKDQVDWALTYDLYFLAMSHHQLGESALAREFYDLALRWSVAHNEALNPYAAELAVIRAEAAELLGVKHKKH
jgi:eukaryotic-like serine/threonine-protein kinase